MRKATLKKLLLASSLSGLFISSALAMDNGMYFGINAGMMWSDSQFQPGVGANANLGYQLNKYVGLEGDFTWTQSQQLFWSSQRQYAEYYAPGQPHQNLDGGSTYYMLAIKGILPLNDDFSLYGKAGMGYNYAYLTNGNATFLNGGTDAFRAAAMLTGGVEWDLSQSFGLTLENQMYFNSNFNGLGNTDIISLGLVLKF